MPIILQVLFAGLLSHMALSALTRTSKEADKALATFRSRMDLENLEVYLHFRHTLPRVAIELTILTVLCSLVFIFSSPTASLWSWDIGLWLISYAIFTNFVSLVFIATYMRVTRWVTVVEQVF